MEQTKIERLKAEGWEVGNTSDFLGLTPEELAFIDLKIALIKRLKQLRISQNISQEYLANQLKTSQWKIAKIEAGDNSVSIDLILKTMFSLGATNQDIIEALQSLSN
ncbi:MAG: helix-turn-helix transcriptional regulator [Gomphosphaeria aponina SAG 52.96 = DSM 107014]|uniref:Helix-turn-helix transcriptional regulator n=1 Tax=Gomphosphaeria aponina SAG 52.96 = DSM 107014 TaxID=1521640 RepID=A0A941GRX7_9CHRO|nr:helix-turn-helix transcriptional regulator [Gomphosphaeria aponina SAG 52.96 = DSM 107014]